MRNIFSLKGRINEKVYSKLMYTLVFGTILLCFLIFMSIFFLPESVSFYVLLLIPAIIFLAIIIWISITVKRLHDLDRSGWECIVCWLPFYGIGYMTFILGHKQGSDGDNRFGKKPLN